jgi:hypothetical protein
MLTTFGRRLATRPQAEGDGVAEVPLPHFCEGRCHAGQMIRNALGTSNWAFASELVFKMEASEDGARRTIVEEAVTTVSGGRRGSSFVSRAPKEYRVLLRGSGRETIAHPPCWLLRADKALVLLKRRNY